MSPRALVLACVGACVALVAAGVAYNAPAHQSKTTELGNFSASLTVKDIKASKALCEKLDFKVVGGQFDQRWIVMQNGSARIGLFQAMFERNLMTFNPGWSKGKQPLVADRHVASPKER